MINLIRADLYRILRGGHFYFAVIIMLAMTTISVFMNEPGYIGNASVTYEDESIVFVTEEGESKSSDKALVRQIIASNINMYYPFVILTFAILVYDFYYRTIKNTLSSSVSRGKYFAAKTLLLLCTAAVFAVLSNLYAYILNFIVHGSGCSESVGNILKATLLQLPMLLGITSVLILLGFVFHNGFLYNTISISFIMVFQIIMGIIYSFTEWQPLGEFLQKYELQAALSRLAYLPSAKYSLTCAAIGIGEIIVCTLLGLFIFKRTEIK